MKGFLRLLSIVVTACVVMLLIMFVSQNSQTVKIQFLSYATEEIYLATALFLSFVLGLVLSSLFFVLDLFRKKLELRSLNKKVNQLNKEVTDLRNQPLFEEKKSTQNQSKTQSFTRSIQSDFPTETS